MSAEETVQDENIEPLDNEAMAQLPSPGRRVSHVFLRKQTI
jgi:hypothetical protein